MPRALTLAKRIATAISVIGALVGCAGQKKSRHDFDKMHEGMSRVVESSKKEEKEILARSADKLAQAHQQLVKAEDNKEGKGFRYFLNSVIEILSSIKNTKQCIDSIRNSDRSEQEREIIINGLLRNLDAQMCKLEGIVEKMIDESSKLNDDETDEFLRGLRIILIRLEQLGINDEKLPEVYRYRNAKSNVRYVEKRVNGAIEKIMAVKGGEKTPKVRQKAELVTLVAAYRYLETCHNLEDIYSYVALFTDTDTPNNDEIKKMIKDRVKKILGRNMTADELRKFPRLAEYVH